MKNFEPVTTFKKLSRHESEYLHDLGALTDGKKMLLLIYNIKQLTEEMSEIRKILKKKKEDE